MEVTIVKLTGHFTCDTAPVVSFMDLGTTVTTSFKDATAITTLATGSTSGAYASKNNLAVPITAGHYYGIAFTNLECVTPTFDVTAQIQ
jgi:hypothetical protein